MDFSFRNQKVTHKPPFISQSEYVRQEYQGEINLPARKNETPCVNKNTGRYSDRLGYFFLAALILAQRALAAAEILALAAALILNFFFSGIVTLVLTGAPSIPFNFFSNDWIFSFRSAARRNCCDDRLASKLMLKE
jgi:hypothetical protein